MKKHLISLLVGVVAALGCAAQSKPFIDHGKPARFLETGVLLSIGGSSVHQNLADRFSEISELSLSMGTQLGIGAQAEIAFTNFISLGVQTNFMINNWKMDLAVADDEASSISNCFIRNHFYSLMFPVYGSFKFNLGTRVRWNVDAGAYYAYGLGGNNKWTLYSAHVNQLGQLITTITNEKAPYYNSREAFIASSYRGDLGVYLASGLTFSRKLSLGVRCFFGCKNQAHAYDAVVNPRILNMSVSGVATYLF